MSPIAARFVTVALLFSSSGCVSEGPADGLHRRIEFDLRRACIAHVGGPRMDSVELLGGRVNTACTRWAHRQAERLAPP